MNERNDEPTISPIGTVYLTSEIARFLRVNERTVQRWIREKKLKAIPAGGGYRVTENDLMEFLENEKENRMNYRERGRARKTA